MLVPKELTDDRYGYFDKMDCSVVTTNAYEKSEENRRKYQEHCRKYREKYQKCRQTLEKFCSSDIGLRNALEPVLKEEEEMEMESTILVYEVHMIDLHKNQVSDLFFKYLLKNYDEFHVIKESQDFSKNRFTPFFRSRSDLSVFRKFNEASSGGKPNEVSSAVAVSFCGTIPDNIPNAIPGASDSDTDDFKGVTLESKMDVKDDDKYQMLANLEKTASVIASLVRSS